MLTTSTQTNTARKPTNPIGVRDTTPITIATHPSHLGRPPWRRTQIPLANLNTAIPARNGRKKSSLSTESVCVTPAPRASDLHVARRCHDLPLAAIAGSHGSQGVGALRQSRRVQPLTQLGEPLGRPRPPQILDARRDGSIELPGGDPPEQQRFVEPLLEPGGEPCRA